ncbi:MAG: DUF1858 domain-containing protein [Marinilabiliaceae bacterium]|jgi:hypothetical protein|nr:DUF1858 domain-containing protein [Marinilabiliaceae bacterium]
MEPIVITPRTKIHDLLEAYPELEETLIKAAPQFRKLKNPLLRKTIARVTSLSQAAIIGGVKVEDLINALREAAGHQLQDSYAEEERSYNFEVPDWFSPDAVREEMDISDMLNAGEQPVHEVLSAIKKLNEGQILEINSPFIPAPLIDKAIGLGYSYWISEVAEDEFIVYFRK